MLTKLYANVLTPEIPGIPGQEGSVTCPPGNGGGGGVGGGDPPDDSGGGGCTNVVMMCFRPGPGQPEVCIPVCYD